MEKPNALLARYLAFSYRDIQFSCSGVSALALAKAMFGRREFGWIDKGPVLDFLKDQLSVDAAKGDNHNLESKLSSLR